jgi:hypothetical protein
LDVAGAVSRTGDICVLEVAVHCPEAPRADLARIEEQVGERRHDVDVVSALRVRGATELLCGRPSRSRACAPGRERLVRRTPETHVRGALEARI